MKGESLMDIFYYLEDQGFICHENIANIKSIEDFFPTCDHCGIYALKFSDGQYYVGQSIDIADRFKQHKKTFQDIEGIAIKSVMKAYLDEQEIYYINELEKRCPLRNIVHTTFPSISNSDFSSLMSLEDQESWLLSPHPKAVCSKRIIDETLRNKTARRCEKLLRDPAFYNKVLPIMREYVQKCLPVPHLTELSFWSVSCLPPRTRPHIELYSRINVRFQEIMTTALNHKTGFIILRFHACFSEIEDCLDDLFSIAPSLRKMPAYNYSYAGNDQICLEVANSADGHALLQNTDFLRGIKKFNLARMRCGPNPFAQTHSPALADHLLNTSL